MTNIPRDKCKELKKKLDDLFLFDKTAITDDSRINKLYEVLRNLIDELIEISWNGVD